MDAQGEEDGSMATAMDEPSSLLAVGTSAPAPLRVCGRQRRAHDEGT